MVYQVAIYGAFGREYASTWQVKDEEGPLGAANAAYVRAFGSDPGEPRIIERESVAGAVLYLRGLRVELTPLVSEIKRYPPKRRARDMERAAERKRAAAASAT